MPEEIKDTIGNVSVSVLVQAVITLILTCTVVALVILERNTPQTIMTVWLVSVGLWMPRPTAIKDG